ncbi:TetR family transcriptional regulator [Streptohalobacillus salinus]|uniref:TetR family transcriptional regulator n=1 Tax=Streptohalobacillus salinus TaxID=621096 RepID=A0A2V3WHM0_9BACI|nr:dihydroxyacetone kinase transcriptional activator DhaS [Streptohalobacillus salinus]PXW88299.1 TetR family transcriptional regulator [Streptohalobacillus salinus]
MNQSIITKKIIAHAFKTLMQKEAFVKISVSDIMKMADMRRQTFYYHFQDKFELLEWIYQTETKENISDFLDYERWDTILNQVFVYFYRHQKYYKNALAITEQNGFREYLYINLKALFSKALTDLYQSSVNLTEKKKETIASFFSHGLVGIITDWIEAGCVEPPEELADYVYTYLINKMCEKKE